MQLLVTFTLMLALISEATIIDSDNYSQYCNRFIRSQAAPKTCLDLRCLGFTHNGVYKVYPDERALYYISQSLYHMDVYCDQETDGGGWTVFQRRMDGSVDFFRNWQNYKLGFGNVGAEHWLGLEKIHQLLSVTPNNELRVDLQRANNDKAYALYTTFAVGNETTRYKLTVAGDSGTAGDSLSGHNEFGFSTFDNDNQSKCANRYHGAWWYERCHWSNLNGRYYPEGNHTSYADGIDWHSYRGYHEGMKTSEMKFRPEV